MIILMNILNMVLVMVEVNAKTGGQNLKVDDPSPEKENNSHECGLEVLSRKPKLEFNSVYVSKTTETLNSFIRSFLRQSTSDSPSYFAGWKSRRCCCSI